MIVNGNSKRHFGMLLPDYIVVKYANDVLRLGKLRRCSINIGIPEFIAENVVAKRNAFIADKYVTGGACKQPSDLILGSAAERTDL